MQDLRLWAIEA